MLNFQKLNVQPEVYIPPLSPDELLLLTYNHFEITRNYMLSKTRCYFCQDRKANRDLTHNITFKDKNAVQQKVIDQRNRCFICNKDFSFDNQPSGDRIDCKLSHNLDNVALTCVPCSIERSNRSLELMQTIIQRKQYAVDNYFPLELTNIHVVEQMQNAIVGGLSNVWHRSNIAGETPISYLTCDYINKKVCSTNTKNLVTHITGVDFNVLYPSAYFSIPIEMICNTGNKMLIPGNFKEYIKDK
jgi:hypothetical protein